MQVFRHSHRACNDATMIKVENRRMSKLDISKTAAGTHAVISIARPIYDLLLQSPWIKSQAKKLDVFLNVHTVDGCAAGEGFPEEQGSVVERLSLGVENDARCTRFVEFTGAAG
ncbi:hypothetical protein M436DRAFT_59668 [Aureobasidium namibiae CBS 147.97]|uniref:Uncharacterized protein n=1 Tax=Aureobasidium namibiae CBS 147.97 TaxID=1043004 RepID=A0A074XT02_9PEZI|nr:uncharacterized protein M436DRAFT_59668 [Aureobasidium namibiae CBS 147.97]KEQ77701.1 hypothetical protein M436DRAFT_59668 [Aureobasidium namibiae CBS 147.97]